MTVYHYSADADNWDWLDMPEAGAWEPFTRWNGQRVGDGWTPIGVEISPARLRKNRGRPVDFPSLGIGVPVLSQRALDVLQDLIAGQVEVLPLACEKQSFYVLNVLTSLDCFDEERSEFSRFDDGRMRWIARCVLKARAIHDELIFRLSIDPPSLFVSEDFRRLVEQHQLTGLIFKEVELTPIQ